MSDSLISQFKREYNAPIEEFRQVADLTTRDAISSSRRWEGMLVYVVSENNTYELNGAIDNTAWRLFTGIDDAPEDGDLYARKDGLWSIVPTITAGAIAKLSGEFPNDIVKNGIFSLSSLFTYSVQANQISQDGDVFRVKFRYSLDAGTGTTTIYFRIGSTDRVVGIQSGGAGLKQVHIEFEIIRRTSGTYYWSYLSNSSPTLTTQNSGTGNQDFTNSFPISLRVTSTTADSELTSRYAYFQHLKAQ